MREFFKAIFHRIQKKNGVQHLQSKANKMRTNREMKVVQSRYCKDVRLAKPESSTKNSLRISLESIKCLCFKYSVVIVQVFTFNSLSLLIFFKDNHFLFKLSAF